MNSFRCPNCGFLNFAAAESCKRCKAEFSQNAAAGEFHQQSSAVNSNHVVSAPIQPRRRQSTAAAQFAAGTYQNYQPNSDAGKKSGFATASVVLGILGFFTAGLLGIGAITGIVLGGIAFQRASKKPNEYGGKTASIIGIALNCMSFVGLFFVGIIAAIAIPNLLAARRAANEGSAIAGMRTLLTAEDKFLDGKGGGRCGDLAELTQAQLIGGTMANGQKSGYSFTISKKPDGTCQLFATPLEGKGVTKSGIRSFYADTEEWEIRAADRDGAAADKSAPMIKNLNRSSRGDY